MWLNILKKNAPVNICAKSKKYLLLAKIYESKNVNVGILISTYILVEDMYKYLSISIWPQSQIIEINWCLKLHPVNLT